MAAIGRIQMDPAKVKVVLDWTVPASRKDLQQFLGFANIYLRFTWNYNLVANTLSTLISLNSPFLHPCACIFPPQALTCGNELQQWELRALGNKDGTRGVEALVVRI